MRQFVRSCPKFPGRSLLLKWSNFKILKINISSLVLRCFFSAHSSLTPSPCRIGVSNIFLWYCVSSNCHSSPASVMVPVCLSLNVPSQSCTPPPPVSVLALTAVSPLISPVQSAGSHMPSVCRACGDASCAGVPQSVHNRYAEPGEWQPGIGMVNMIDPYDWSFINTVHSL